ncbi:helicase domain-containing protein [Candidatus Thiomargarita nelsonii]|uniref:Helicase domain-containing protein n=1 Tax=Candidatus Thiomargarita nelsonii TaxID=1003181 RepID=A0A176S7J2_9GAMM|nr:helicase domain-containing protein [Candidatus Thiomargarita nelsonii]
MGFALTQLQRRLASSPESIYTSLKRRHQRLEKRLKEEKKKQSGQHHRVETLRQIDDQYHDFDEMAQLRSQQEEWVDDIVDRTTAARTIKELEAEIETLKTLQATAHRIVQSGDDRKWEELSKLLQESPEMKNGDQRRKLIIFTEYRDTLNYLEARIKNLLGSAESVITIHGGTARDQRYENQLAFRHNPDVLVLIATDAAGEGVNLQNSHLMVNYDLPWNPNRLEQRFGRIHRIGQTEVCHLWNIVAVNTREGAVFKTLFDKIENEKMALGERVFDVLGEAFENVSLKELLIEAIRYGEQPEVKARLTQSIEGALDPEHLKDIIRRNALSEQAMDKETLYDVKTEMEKAEARKLQPYFLRAFFMKTFESLGGSVHRRESNRYEITHVPSVIRERDNRIGDRRLPVTKKYERLCFEKEAIHKSGKPNAELVHTKHPLMTTMINLILEQHYDKLKQGTILVDPNDESLTPTMLFMIDHTVSYGDQQTPISRRLQFVKINEKGAPINAGWAPHLDLEPLEASALGDIEDIIQSSWLNNNIETLALNYAVEHLANKHYQTVQARSKKQADKTLTEVKKRIIEEISYHSDRYDKFKSTQKPGNAEQEERRVKELQARLNEREKEIELIRNVKSMTPIIVGGALIIPQALLAQRQGNHSVSADADARAHIEQIAMQAVMETERHLGHDVKDVSAEHCGWDITASPLSENRTLKPDRHIEVKGRAKGQMTITLTRNEILYALNQRDKFILAIVIVEGNHYEGPYYLLDFFKKELDWGVASINYHLKDMLSKAVTPEQTV